MFVFSNLAISLDGKIDTKMRSAFLLGSSADRREMEKLRARADAVVLGAGSVRSHPTAVPGLLNILITTRLEGFDPKMDFFSSPKAHTIIFLGGKVPEKRLVGFRKTCDIYRLPSGKSGMREFLKVLKKYDVKELLVEGGGEIMWLFANENLIDEYHVTLTPRIIGGKSAPTMVDGEGFLPNRSLRLSLKSSRRVGAELFLVYRR